MKKSSIIFTAFLAIVTTASAATKDPLETRLESIEKSLNFIEEKLDRILAYKMERKKYERRANDENVNDVADMFNDTDKKSQRAEKKRKKDERLANEEDVNGVADMFNDADRKSQSAEKKRKTIEQLEKEIEDLKKANKYEKVKKEKAPKKKDAQPADLTTSVEK